MSNNPIFQLVFTLIVAGGGAYLGSYLREKGKSTATKEDIGHITTIVEQVKTEIGRQDWAQREWTNLRRVKLEELLIAAQARSKYVFSVEMAAPHGKLTEENDPTLQVEMLTALYFPELEVAVRSVVAIGNQKLMNALRTTAAVAKAKESAHPFQQHLTAFNMSISTTATPMLTAEQTLRSEARALLLRIMPSTSGISPEA